MSRYSLLCALAIAGAALAFALGHATAQEEFQPPKWMEPTQEHADLAKSVGTWEVSANYYMVPGQALPFAGVAVRKSILNGRFIEETFTCDFGGMPFEGHLLQGYDTNTKEFVHVWVDSSSPHIDIARGTMKDGVLTTRSNGPDMTGAMRAKRSTMKVIGPDHTEMKMYQNDASGKEQLMMDMVYKRKK